MAETIKEKWLQYFNPCGVEPIKGYALQRCPSPDCGSTTCLSKIAYCMAGFILHGSTRKNEQAEVERYLRSLNDPKLVSVDGTTVELDDSNLPQEVAKIMARAGRILEGINSCVEATDLHQETFFGRSSPQLQETLTRYKTLNDQANQFQGTITQATALADQMQSTLNEALDLGADSLGIIARHALVFGLADRLPAIDQSGLIFTGNINNLIPIK